MHLSPSLLLCAHLMEFDSMWTGDLACPMTGDLPRPPLPSLSLLTTHPLLLTLLLLLVSFPSSNLVVELFQCKQDKKEGSWTNDNCLVSK